MCRFGRWAWGARGELATRAVGQADRASEFPRPISVCRLQSIRVTMARYIRWFRELALDDVPSVGGKNASLGELYRELAPKGIRIPDGFAVTADAYRRVLASAELDQRIHKELAELD